MKTLPFLKAFRIGRAPSVPCKAPPTCLHELPAARIGKSKARRREFFFQACHKVSRNTTDDVGVTSSSNFCLFVFWKYEGGSEVTWETFAVLIFFRVG